MKRILAVFLVAAMMMAMAGVSSAAAATTFTASGSNITGTVGEALAGNVTITITAEGGSDGFAGGVINAADEDLSGWFGNLPKGLTAKSGAEVESAMGTMTIIIGGTLADNADAVDEALEIEIPANIIKDGGSVAANPVNVTTTVKFVIAAAADPDPDPSGDDETSDASSGTIGGDGEVQEVIIRVTVPTDLDFAIDPFETGNTIGGGQITGESYKFVNKTADAPIKVGLSFQPDLSGEDVATATDAVLVEDPSELSPDDETVTDKKLYLAVLGASTFEVATASTTTFDAETDGTLVPFVASGTSAFGAEVAFALEAGDGTNPADGNGGVAAFTFYGVLNSYADWQDNDVVINCEYLLSPLRPKTYETTAASTVGVNQIPAAGSGEGNGGGTTTPWYEAGTTWTGALPATGQNSVIPFDARGGQVMVKSSGGNDQAVNSVWTYDNTNKTVTIMASKLNAANAGYSMIIAVTGGTAPGNYTLTWSARA